jgi:hypothetical protein
MTSEAHDTGGGEEVLTASAEAVLAYGYDLGGTGEWKVHEALEDEHHYGRPGAERRSPAPRGV